MILDNINVCAIMRSIYNYNYGTHDSLKTPVYKNKFIIITSSQVDILIYSATIYEYTNISKYEYLITLFLLW